MEEQLRNLLILATALTPLVTGLVELMKRYTPAEGKLLPILGIVVGIVLGGLWAVSFEPVNIIAYLWAGGIAGMASVGLYKIVGGVK